METLEDIGKNSIMLNKLKEAKRMIESVRYSPSYSWVSVRVGKTLQELKDCIQDIENEMRVERNALFTKRRS